VAFWPVPPTRVIEGALLIFPTQVVARVVSPFPRRAVVATAGVQSCGMEALDGLTRLSMSQAIQQSAETGDRSLGQRAGASPDG
jgi:hypothetical protein